MRQKILRKGAKVKRWHTLTNVKEQTVADHSWGVVSIILDVWPNSSIALITFALWHDVPEFAIGDIPVTAKWENKNLAKELEKIEQIYNSLDFDQTLDYINDRIKSQTS